jgi:hypothetical protein
MTARVRTEEDRDDREWQEPKDVEVVVGGRHCFIGRKGKLEAAKEKQKESEKCGP